MSGAEGLVVLSVAANVLQFVEFATELCNRIRDYSNGPGMPRKLAALADQLADLIAILKSRSYPLKPDPLEEQVVRRCFVQAEELSLLLESLRASKGDQDHWWKNARKALKSLSRAEKIEELQSTLNNLINTLSLQLLMKTRDTNADVDDKTTSILRMQNDQVEILREIYRLSKLKLDGQAEHISSDQPVWLVSISRNPDFVGREPIIEELERRLVSGPDSARTAVLYGLGGVGKSQIALEYAYRKKRTLQELSVFWIHATNAARFVESFKRIASALDIPGRESPEIDVLLIVQDYLEIKHRCDWLMIIDNVDDRSMFFEDESYKGKRLCEYVPQTSRGAILYTTRNREIGIDLDHDRNPIEVGSMGIEEARMLLGSKLKAESTEDQQVELLEELVYLPLAITQAVAFMMKRRKSIRQYLDDYKRSDSTRLRLLNQKSLYHGREARPLESVITTWRISFESIKTENPRAANLLSVMSFFDRQSIPDSLLILDDEEPMDFEESVEILNAFSLIARNERNDSSDMHRLVQVATRAWLLEDEGSAESTAAEALGLLSTKFPNGWYENWNTCSMLLPHADAVLGSFKERTDSHAALKAKLLLNTSSYLRRQGRFGPAELRSAESKAIFERLHGLEHADTLAATADYAMIIHKRGSFEEAVRLQRIVLEGREKVLGKSHRLTLETLNALGYDLRSLGRFREAEQIHRREMTEKQRLLDQDPEDFGLQADLLVAVNNSARLLSNQNKHAEAERMHRDALKKSSALLGPTHPDTLITMGELASDLRDQDKLEEAQQIYETLIASRSRVLGDLHPDTLLSKSNLATLKSRQGKRNEAEILYREVYEQECQVLGKHHPSSLNTQHNLACILADQGKGEQAADAFQEVLEGQNRLLGVAHTDTLMTRTNLSISLSDLGRKAEAERIDRETLELSENRAEKNDAQHVRILVNLAAVLADQSKFSDAEVFRRQQLELNTQLYGSDSIETDSCRQVLANLLRQLDNLPEAITLNRTVLDYRARTLGWEDDETLVTLWNLALCYRDAKMLHEAELSYRQLVDLKSKKYSPDDDEVLESLVQLAWVQQQSKKYPESEKNYRQLLEAQIKTAGPDDPFTLMVTNNLASVLQYQHKNQEAELLFRRAFSGRLKVLGQDDPKTIHSRRVLGEFLDGIGKPEEAALLLEPLTDTADTHPELPSEQANPETEKADPSHESTRGYIGIPQPETKDPCSDGL